MGFSGGAAGQTKPHTHDSLIVNDGGELNFDNITQASLTAGDITFSDGTHLQRLAIGNPADSLVVNGGGTAPEWGAGSDPHNAGMLVCWAGALGSIPSGWLLCDGASVATATYPDLHTAIGYVYGGAGANFNLPDLVDRFVRGQSTQTAATGGADSLTLSTAQMPQHTHTATTSVTDPGHVHTKGFQDASQEQREQSGTHKDSETTNTGSATTGITVSVTNADTGSSNSFDNRPAYLEMQYIIKT